MQKGHLPLENVDKVFEIKVCLGYTLRSFQPFDSRDNTLELLKALILFEL